MNYFFISTRLKHNQITLKVKLLGIVAIIFSLAFSCKKKVESPLVFQPGPREGKDAFIEDYPYNNYCNRNFGMSDVFPAIAWTAKGTNFYVRSLIEFPFKKIPNNAIIDSVKLSMYAYGNKGFGKGHDPLGGSNECWLRRVTSSWNEKTVTWNTQPTITTQNQIFIPGSTDNSQDYIDIDITALVKDIIDNPGNSYGLMLILDNETHYRRMMFASSDAIIENKRPKVQVFFRYKD